MAVAEWLFVYEKGPRMGEIINANYEDRIRCLEKFMTEANERQIRMDERAKVKEEQSKQIKWWISSVLVPVVLSLITALVTVYCVK